MSHTSPILIVEDDQDDCELIQTALKDMGITNEQKCFGDGKQALNYLQNSHEKTFLILSDINMPNLNGFELKKKINANESLKKQAIPFVYLTTSNSKQDIDKAYDVFAQGFFTKPNNYNTLIGLLTKIIQYWKSSEAPAS